MGLRPWSEYTLYIRWTQSCLNRDYEPSHREEIREALPRWAIVLSLPIGTRFAGAGDGE